MRLVCGILFATLFLAVSSNAQMSGRIAGSVVDASGAAVGGADVELYLAGGQKPLLVSRTSTEGLYHFIGVRPAEYDLSKVLSDADGDSQTRLQHFLDIANLKIERSRANFDLTHMIKMDGYYELPFGKGHKLSYHRLDHVIGGWVFGSTLVWQSGAPFSILSERGTLNRESRPYYNTADTSLTQGQLDSVGKFQVTGNGPMMIAKSAINAADGTGVNTDGAAAFNGQIFFNPGAGTLGVLQRRLFEGPWTFTTDM